MKRTTTISLGIGLLLALMLMVPALSPARQGESFVSPTMAALDFTVQEITRLRKRTIILAKYAGTPDWQQAYIKFANSIGEVEVLLIIDLEEE